MKFAIVMRLSPTNKGVEESKDIQFTTIMNKICSDFRIKQQDVQYETFFDICEGDNPNRASLNLLFTRLTEFDFVYAFTVDRWSRSYLGLMWFEQYFKDPKHPMLRFAIGLPDLYAKNRDTGAYEIDLKKNVRELDGDSYIMFAMQIAISQGELYKLRFRNKKGLERLRQNPELWKQKYQGRKAGSKNAKKQNGRKKNKI